MICPSCRKEVAADGFFCTWCSTFIPAPAQGRKAGLFARWVALAIDPLIAIALWFLGIGAARAITGSNDAALVVAVLLPMLYFVWFLVLLRQGLTPGKRMLGLQVLDGQTGSIPGFGKMFVREIVGRIVSGLFFGMGYIWALFDKNAQAWHDKLAGTVVVKVGR